MPEVRYQVSEDVLIPGICRLTSGLGAVAQLGEHLLCKQGVTGSIPVGSTSQMPDDRRQASEGAAPRKAEG
jgi:hypothetical protein